MKRRHLLVAPGGLLLALAVSNCRGTPVATTPDTTSSTSESLRIPDGGPIPVATNRPMDPCQGALEGKKDICTSTANNLRNQRPNHAKTERGECELASQLRRDHSEWFQAGLAPVSDCSKMP
jgi:hypothetical protein